MMTCMPSIMCALARRFKAHVQHLMEKWRARSNERCSKLRGHARRMERQQQVLRLLLKEGDDKCKGYLMGYGLGSPCGRTA